MTWQVAVVVDEETDVESLLEMMPVWATSTPTRKAAAPELWKKWNDLWIDAPALTLWSAPWGDAVLAKLVEEVPTIEIHHPGLACLRLFGIPLTGPLTEAMAAHGFHPVSGTTFPGVSFARSIEAMQEVPVLSLDATGWNEPDDFYSAFFRAVGAAEWHGRIFDALIDSIQTGRINSVEVPYQIRVINSVKAGPASQAVLSKFGELVSHMQSNGCPVSLTLQS